MSSSRFTWRLRWVLRCLHGDRSGFLDVYMDIEVGS